MQQRYSVVSLSERVESWRKFLPYALLLSITFGLYAQTLYFEFVWDDFDYVVENYRIQGYSLAHIWTIWSSRFAEQYVPLHHSFLAFLYSIAGLNAHAYHSAQLLLHASCVCLLFFILQKIESRRIAWLATLLFVVYAPNIETVAWISETKSTLAFLFFLLSFFFFLRLRNGEHVADGLACAFFLTLSLLTKINTVVAPAIFLLYDYKQGYVFKKSRVWSLACFSLISAAFAALQLFYSYRGSPASGDRLLDAVLPDHNLLPLDPHGGYYGGLQIHLLNLPRFLLFYIRMAVFPRPLSAWHMFRVYDGFNWTLAACWLLMAALAWLLYRSSRDVRFWALWFLIFLLPVLQIVPNPIWVADRYLYVPAIGAFVLLSKLFFYTWERLGQWRLQLAWEALMIFVVLAFAWQTYRHVPVWRDELTLWGNTISGCETSAYCHGRLGKALMRNGETSAAMKELLQAVQIRPSPVYLMYLGDAYAENLADYRQALMAYGIARQNWGPMPLFFWAKVAKTYYLAGDLDRATRVIDSGQKFDADDPGLLLVKAFVQWKRGDRNQARHCVERLLAMNSLYPESSGANAFINYYWGHPAETAQLLAEIGLNSGVHAK